MVGIYTLICFYQPGTYSQFAVVIQNPNPQSSHYEVIPSWLTSSIFSIWPYQIVCAILLWVAFQLFSIALVSTQLLIVHLLFERRSHLPIPAIIDGLDYVLLLLFLSCKVMPSKVGSILRWSTTMTVLSGHVSLSYVITGRKYS